MAATSSIPFSNPKTATLGLINHPKVVVSQQMRSKSLACRSSSHQSPITEFNLYELLGVDASSNKTQIKEAYRALQKRCHPDIAGPPGHDMAIILNQAYALLSDPFSRLAYDKELAKVSDLQGYTGRPIYSTWFGPENEQRAVFVDEVKCIGCLKCALFANNTFAVESVYGRARVVAQWADPEHKIQEGIDACPVDCISIVERSDLAALEFLMSKQPRGRVRIGAGNTVGARAGDIFNEVEKFKARYAQHTSKNDSKSQAHTESMMSAIQAIQLISNWLYWQTPSTGGTPLAIQISKQATKRHGEPSIKKLKAAAAAVRKQATTSARPRSTTDEYWVPSPLTLPTPDPSPKSQVEPIPIRKKVRTNYNSKVSYPDKERSKNPLRWGKGVTFYKPIGIPDGFFSLGYYCQPSDKQLRGYVLVAKGVYVDHNFQASISDSVALAKPLNYSLVWSSDSRHSGCGYIWLPNPPEGYRPMGFVVTVEPDEPDIEEVRCVRADLTDGCEVSEAIFDMNSLSLKDQFYVWNTRPSRRGMLCEGVPVGTFFCSQVKNCGDELSIACLRNLDCSLRAMPNLDQIHALINHYGPTVYFHPDEAYLPSSVSWFFENGALLYKQGRDKGLAIDAKGSNLPGGGKNDGEFWIDLPEDDRDYVKRGHIESAELYVHVKPALGGTFTDIVIWIFCPFNGPATIKAGLWSYTFSNIGQHVGDWEHYTLRLSNFNGELWSVYFSEHSGGGWVDASELEFIKGNKAIVYASKHGHASFPHEGCYIQGSSALGIGARNDCAKSKYSVDSSAKYQIVGAEYLGDELVREPHWLQYMREWGPTVVYDSTSELEKILNHLPFFVKFSVENLIELFPTELYGEEGPTGPKEKDNWWGDERC